MTTETAVDPKYLAAARAPTDRVTVMFSLGPRGAAVLPIIAQAMQAAAEAALAAERARVEDDRK